MNDRPRSGAVFECWKFAKKRFRKASRTAIRNVCNKTIRKLNGLFRSGDSGRFWNFLKQTNAKNCSSTLTAKDFRAHYSDVMTDILDLDEEQTEISNIVKNEFRSHCNDYFECEISMDQVKSAILSLKKGKAAGVDLISTEHLQYGLSPVLCSFLGQIITVMLSWHVVGADMLTGSIVPVLKKPTLDPNIPGNYRQITVSTCYSKLLECLIKPDCDNCCDTQFGFRSGLGTDQACAFLHDTV